MKKLAQFIRSWCASATRQAVGLNRENILGAKIDADAIIRVSPGYIRFKLLGRTIRALRADDTPPDDWDLDRRPIEETAKYISVVQHFRDGRPWEDTPIFRRYAQRFSRGEEIRGCRSIDDLKEVYRADMNALYQSLSERGFLFHEEHERKRRDLPHVYVGRDGEIIFGSDGNHRLAIARLLELREIPCRVLRRHADWDNLRQELAAVEVEYRNMNVKPVLAGHPDLQDILPHDAAGRDADSGSRACRTD